MKRSLLPRFSWCLAYLVLAFCQQTPRVAADPLAEKEIERLIRDLGSANFEVREAATRTLREREGAAFALHKALSSPDAEIRRRAANILEALEPKRARRILARGLALGNEGRVVEMVDRLVYWRRWDTHGEGWNGLTQLADKLIELTARDVVPRGFPHNARFRQNPRFPAGDFQHYAEMAGPKETSGRKLVNSCGGGIVLLRGEDVTVDCKEYRGPGIYTGIVAASEEARLFHAVDSLIIVGGDVKMQHNLMRSIIVCDGDVEMQGPPETGLIIARGKVTCRERKLTDSGCIIRSENYYQFRNGKKIIIKDGTPDPLAFVKFFELSDVGLVAADAHEKSNATGVPLQEVRKNSPFASALRAGDVVTALDGTKVTSTEVFRRLLRRKLGRGGPSLAFTVRRGKQTFDLTFPVRD